MNSLEIKNLTKEYKTFKLDNISFNIPKGYILGFIGKNGAGKTTTIKSMLNLVKKNHGEVKVFGLDMDIAELEIKKKIGYVSGEIFYPKKRIKDVTDVFQRFYDQWDNALYQSFLTQFHLDESKQISELSKGMQLKFQIALALSHHAELLILDEPTSGLDPVARDSLLEIFQTIVEEGEVSILFSTHITSDLDKCADYVVFIQDGKIVENSSKDDLIDKYRIVNGTKEELKDVKDILISYKENSLGFNGLIHTSDLSKARSIRYGQPSLDEIMIYFAEKEEL